MPTLLQSSMEESDSVLFLGKEYTIPSDLGTYIRLLHFFDKMKTKLTKTINKKLQATLSDDMAGIMEVDVEPIFKPHVDAVLKMLCDNSIFNNTLDDYLKNSGYASFCDINRQGLKKTMELLIEDMQSFEAGWQSAEARANSSVTGSGISVFSSSFTTLAVAAAYDYSCSKRQFEKADAQYKAEIQFLCDANQSARRKKVVDYLNNTYFPNAESAISLFVFGLMDQYLKDLAYVKKFDMEALKYADFKKSQGILENLNRSIEKTAILEAAFLACPFNDMVYVAAADATLCDIETMKTACKYCPDNTLAEKIVDNCRVKTDKCDFAEEYAKVLPSIQIVALKMGCTETEAVKALFEIPYNFYINKLSALNSISPSFEKNVKEFVLHNIAKNADALSTMHQDQIREKVSLYICNLISDENCTFLANIGYTFNQLGDNGQEKFAVGFWVERLTNVVVEYIATCTAEREKMEKIKTDYNTTVLNMENAIAQLEKDLLACGVLSFSKKSELRNKIASSKRDLDAYRSQFNISGKEYSFSQKYI